MTHYFYRIDYCTKIVRYQHKHNNISSVKWALIQSESRGKEKIELDQERQQKENKEQTFFVLQKLLNWQKLYLACLFVIRWIVVWKNYDKGNL